MSAVDEVRALLHGVEVEHWPSLLSAVDRADKWAGELPQQARIHFLRNFTVEGVEPFLKYHLYPAGIRPVVSFGEYGAFQQEMLDLQSPVNRGDVDLAVLSLVLEDFSPGYGAVGWDADEAAGRLESTLDELAAVKTAAVANTFIPPFYSETGIALDADGTESKVERLNRLVRSCAGGQGIAVADWERIARRLGERESFNYRYWYMYKAPFTQAFLHAYAHELARMVRALKGQSKKCLVLDCDNTLWGGVVGEDGPGTIGLDDYEYPGRAFYDFQRTVLHLVARGVLVALCSKNNEEDVWEVLDGHDRCLLKRSHLAAWRINWDNKADNLRSIADELNIGLDSLVFVDDSPVECDLVRSLAPEVTVLQVPNRLYDFPNLLLKDGLFDTLSISAEDLRRTEYYRSEAERKVEARKFEDVEQYLHTLGIEAVVGPVRAEDIPRVAQLTQKTNQFNLTTRRYSVADIEGLAAAAESAVMTLEVKDRFGDMGLTGVLIAHGDGEEAVIDLLLLSCRILGRRLEYAFVDYCLGLLEGRWEVARWRACYLPTRKNGQVADFWEMFGFSAERDGEGRKDYAVDPASRVVHQLPYIHINTQGEGLGGTD